MNKTWIVERLEDKISASSVIVAAAFACLLAAAGPAGAAPRLGDVQQILDLAKAKAKETPDVAPTAQLAGNDVQATGKIIGKAQTLQKPSANVGAVVFSDKVELGEDPWYIHSASLGAKCHEWATETIQRWLSSDQGQKYQKDCSVLDATYRTMEMDPHGSIDIGDRCHAFGHCEGSIPNTVIGGALQIKCVERPEVEKHLLRLDALCKQKLDQGDADGYEKLQCPQVLEKIKDIRPAQFYSESTWGC